MAEVSMQFMGTGKLIELLEAEKARGLTFTRIDQGRLVLGADAHRPDRMIDFGGEVARPIEPTAPKTVGPRGPRLSRQSGKYLLDVKGRTTESHSLKDMLAAGLCAAEHHRPGTLEKLSHVKPRTKRIVARDPKDLFENENLVANCAHQLMPGWWFGSNNSAQETEAWLKRACELSGLTWGVDFSTTL